ncbi:MAG: hypothetical protein WA637_07375, partial [Terriglobales bacterium]
MEDKPQTPSLYCDTIIGQLKLSAMFSDLRPLSLGELLDRSFFLYRKNFMLFVGIIALPHLVLLAFQLAGVVLQTERGFLLGPVVSALWLLGTAVVSLGATAA